MDLLRQYVGGPKNRYKDEKFNLDLTYITPRLIAMAFPASGIQQLYRNPVETVKDFLIQHHGNNYMIANLSGRQIDQSILHNVFTFNWQDHQAPPLEMLFNICNLISDFLLKNQNNVVAVNCNHGKGRTGTIVCCLLLYFNIVRNSEIALDFYAKKRFQTEEGYGVTQPCQIKYIQYFEQVLKNPSIRPRIVALTRIVFRGQMKYDCLYIKAKQFSGRTIVTTKKSETNTFFHKAKTQNNIKQLVLTLSQQKYFYGDCKFYIKCPSTLGSITVASYSFNTAFLKGSSQTASFFELSPYSLRKSDNFSKNFQIQFQFKDYCKCPPQIPQQQRCNQCRHVMAKQQQKWKQMANIIAKRSTIEQSQKQNLLGFYPKNNKKDQKHQMQHVKSLQININGIKQDQSKKA